MSLSGLVDVIHWLEGVFERLQDLIVFKKIFDRPKDILDIKAVLMAQKGKMDLDRLKSDARDLLSDEKLRELEALIAEYGQS